LKPERRVSPLVQEKYRGEKACGMRQRIIIIIIIIIYETSVKTSLELNLHIWAKYTNVILFIIRPVTEQDRAGGLRAVSCVWNIQSWLQLFLHSK
jgi:hypothetical protein